MPVCKRERGKTNTAKKIGESRSVIGLFIICSFDVWGLKNSKLKEGVGRRACECRHGGDTNMCQLPGVFLIILFFNEKYQVRNSSPPPPSMNFWPLTLPGQAYWGASLQPCKGRGPNFPLDLSWWG